jgi:hypothetical protein
MNKYLEIFDLIHFHFIKLDFQYNKPDFLCQAKILQIINNDFNASFIFICNICKLFEQIIYLASKFHFYSYIDLIALKKQYHL